MHEFSIIQSLFNTIYKYAYEQNAKEVTRVVLKAGLLSGIEPYLFKIAFDTFKDGSIAEKAELVLKEETIKLKCNKCGSFTEVDKIVFKCQDCGSLQVEVINGEGLILERLEMECY